MLLLEFSIQGRIRGSPGIPISSYCRSQVAQIISLLMDQTLSYTSSRRILPGRRFGRWVCLFLHTSQTWMISLTFEYSRQLGFNH